MGSKYIKKFEREWSGKTTTDIKIATLHKQADRNISRICKGQLVVRRRRYR